MNNRVTNIRTYQHHNAVRLAIFNKIFIDNNALQFVNKPTLIYISFQALKNPWPRSLILNKNLIQKIPIPKQTKIQLKYHRALSAKNTPGYCLRNRYI